MEREGQSLWNMDEARLRHFDNYLVLASSAMDELDIASMEKYLKGAYRVIDACMGETDVTDMDAEFTKLLEIKAELIEDEKKIPKYVQKWSVIFRKINKAGQEAGLYFRKFQFEGI